MTFFRCPEDVLKTSVSAELQSCGHTCTDLGIPIAGEVDEKEELKNVVQWGKR